MNKGKYKVIPKGEIFIVTHGEYSDYMVMEVYRANRELVPKTLERTYLKESDIKESAEGRFNKERFLNWLEQNGHATAVDNWSELHIGDYDTADMQIADWRYQQEGDK